MRMEGAMTPEERRDAWNRDGFFIERGFVGPHVVAAIEDETIKAIRSDPPAAHADELIYHVGDDLLIYPEKDASPSATNPEDYVGKVFNCHAEGAAKALALDARIVDVVANLLGGDVDVFQSQFIFKNPSVIGQPWHQDSYYFRFDRQPQIGVWVALSEATLENGCLWVVPGSHKGPIFGHEPDRRPGANKGYLEIVSEDTAAKIPVLMAPGDVLFFHSYLMHMSTDNVAKDRRAAMVYHYARAGTRAEFPEAAAALAHVNRWLPARRAAGTAVTQNQ